MKSISLVVAAALALPLVAIAQTDPLKTRCLPQAQQDEISVKANAIEEAATLKRNALGPAVGPGHRVDAARKTKTDWDEALAACLAQARAGGRGAEACERESFHVRIAAKALEEITTNTQSLSAIQAEREQQMDALRKNYPACPGA